MKSNPLLGLVTVLYKSNDVLQGFFNSLLDQDYKNIRLYIVDNSPDEESLNIAKTLSGNLDVPVEFIINRDNPGVATGNNNGIELAIKDKCDYVLLLNNDIEFGKETITNMIKYAVTYDEAIVVPKILYHNTAVPIIWYAGGYLSYMQGTSFHRGDLELDVHQYDFMQHVTYAPTCFMLIKNEVFKNCGLMDDNYFIYYDDTDFVFRAIKKYKILYLPSSVVLHKVSHSSGGTSEDVLKSFFGRKSKRISLKKFKNTGYLILRNQTYYIKKNYPLTISGIILILAMMRVIVGVIIYDKNKFLRFVTLVRAVSAGLKKRMGNPYA